MTDNEVREQILAAAFAVIAEKGFARASMNDIVRAAGISKGGVYWHFKNKDEVIAAVFSRYFDHQLQQFDQTLVQEGSVADKLRLVAHQLGEMLEQINRDLPSPMELYALAARDDALLAHLRAYFDAYRTRVAALIRTGIETGELRPTDPDEAALTIISLFEGTVLLYAAFAQQANAAEQIVSGINLLFAGLQKG